ncbi:MAG: hypothetical protein E6J91_51030 [Deltaproteobacteria bacterium]|nr:MAG: hypothetical protein E6J91_51030 [Deltaproteobacteria bacterium]
MDVGALAKVLDQPAERRGLDLGTDSFRDLRHALGVAQGAWYVSAVPVTELVCGGTTFHVVGTAHVSQHSVDEVRAVIARVRPDAVCVELDRRRYDALTRGTAFRDLDVLRVVREGRALYVLAQIALAAYQRRIGARLGIKPGAELLAAIEAAHAAGIPVELIDRDIDITFYRTWRNLGLGTRAALIASLLVAFGSAGGRRGDPLSAQDIEDLKHPRALSDMLTAGVAARRGRPEPAHRGRGGGRGARPRRRGSARRRGRSAKPDRGWGTRRLRRRGGGAPPWDRPRRARADPAAAAAVARAPVAGADRADRGVDLRRARRRETGRAHARLDRADLAHRGRLHAGRGRPVAVGRVGTRRRADRGAVPAAGDRPHRRRDRGRAAPAEPGRPRAAAERHRAARRVPPQPGDPDPARRARREHRHRGRVLDRRGPRRPAPVTAAA